MADVEPLTRSAPPGTPAQPDWADQTADTIVRVVGNVRDRTTGPALLVVRAVVYGMFIALVGMAALVLFTILAVRFIDNYLPSSVFGDEHVWMAHLILGLLFAIIGTVLFRQRKSGMEQRPAAKR